MREYAYTQVCLELDMFKGSKLHQAKREAKVKLVPDKSVKDSTAMRMKDATAELKLLRAECQNAMVLAAMTFSNRSNRSLLRVISTVTKPCLDWHAEQSRELRSTQGTLSWCISQASGGFFPHLGKIAGSLSDVINLERIGIRSRYVSTRDSVFTSIEGEPYWEKELATRMADLVIALLAPRVKRFLWLIRGWPARACLMIKDHNEEGTIKKTLKDFLEDYDNYQYIKGLTTPGIAEKKKRSIFELMSVEHLVRCLAEERYEATQKFDDMLKLRFNRLMGTQVLEDGFNRQRRKEELSKNKQGRPQMMMQKLISTSILSGVHHFAEATVDERVIQRGTKLGSDVFHPSGKVWERLREVIGYNRNSTWWSSTPDNQAVPYADLELYRWVRARKREKDLQTSWLSCLLRGPRLLLREVRTKRWFFVLCEITTSASIGWPAMEVQCKAKNETWFAPRQDVVERDLCYIVVLDDKTYECMSFEWMAPLATWSIAPKTRGCDAFEQVLARPTVKPMSLLSAAARNGFYDLSRQALEQLQHFLSIAKTPGASMFDICFGLCKHITKASDDQVMDFLYRRVIEGSAKQSVVQDELLQMDEISDQLDKEMQDQYNEEKKDKKQREANRKEFEEGWRAKRAKVPSKNKSSSGRSSSSRQGSGGTAETKKQFPAEAPSSLEVLQRDIRHLTPDGGYIWRGNQSSTWNCHFEPHPRKSFSAKIWGEREAILRCLRSLWDSFNTKHGLAEQTCPIAGIYPESVGDIDGLPKLDEEA